MGLQDVFFRMRLPFDAPRGARAVDAHLGGDLLPRPARLVRARREDGPHPAFAETRAARGELQFDAWGVVPDATWRAGTRCASGFATHGLRNSLLIAIAPTATIASIAGCYECIEPQVSNLFKRETLSGDFLQVNRYLVEELKALGLWTEAMRNAIKIAEGSVQGIDELPDEHARDLPHGLGDPDALARSTWPPTAARSSTRASRSTCSWRTRTSASCPRCTSTPGRRG